MVYNTGNSDATGAKDGQNVRGGFGHLGITVPDVYEACERFQVPGYDRAHMHAVHMRPTHVHAHGLCMCMLNAL